MSGPPRRWLIGQFLELESDASRELVSGALERGVRGAVRRTLEPRVGHAPVHELRARRELRAHLANAIAERDHLVEALRDELVDVLRAVRADVDVSPLEHTN